jgi:hypothetical protein
MAALLNNVGFTATAGGTTDWTYSARVAGYNNPADANVQNGVTYVFHAFSGDRSQWEITRGAYSSAGAGSFARTTVLYNSSQTGTATGQSGAGTKINFSAAPTVVVVAIADDLIGVDYANSFSAAQKSQARTNIGAVLNTVQTVDTTNRSTTSASFVASSVISPSITPDSTSNKILVQVSGIIGASTGAGCSVALYRSIGGGAYSDLTLAGVTEMQGFVIPDANTSVSMGFSFLDSPSTTSAVLYQVYFKVAAGAATVYLGRRGTDTLFDSPTIITATEVK